ncbi:hypothetical protein LCGC14_1623210, partial [marine sediment metagenome]
WDQAYDLSGWENDWLSSLYSGEGIQLDDDWYMVNVKSENGHLIIEINFDHFEGNISLELYYDSQSPLASSNTTNENYAFVDFELQKSGTYYIHVFGENKGNWYDLKWRTQDEAKDFYDDSYEYNNEPERSYSLWGHERTWLSKIGGELAVQGDEDWYLIDVSAGFLHLKVNVIFNHSAGDIDIEIYEMVNLGEVNPVIENNSRTDNEYINYTLSHPGVYLIQIRGENANNEYDLWWDDLRTLFDEDIYEPNDSYLNATDITANDNYEIGILLEDHLPKMSAEGPENEILSLRTSDGLGLQYDEDWYETYVPEERLNLLITLIYDYAEGVMGLEVYDFEMRKVAENFTEHDGEIINVNLRLNGTYYIRVFGDNTGNVYDLMWATSELPIENIPGYDILILLGSLFGIVSIIAIKWKRNKLKQK